MSVSAMSPFLDSNPLRDVASTLRDGFMYGFFIPFHLSWSPRSADNLRSAKIYHQVLRDKMAKEVSSGRIASPFFPPFSNLRISPLGIVPKKDPASTV